MASSSNPANDSHRKNRRSNEDLHAEDDSMPGANLGGLPDDSDGAGAMGTGEGAAIQRFRVDLKRVWL
jgi:hypothetical protein